MVLAETTQKEPAIAVETAKVTGSTTTLPRFLVPALCARSYDAWMPSSSSANGMTRTKYTIHATLPHSAATSSTLGNSTTWVGAEWAIQQWRKSGREVEEM